MKSIVSLQYQFVIGVDTHAATHTFALVAGATGAVLDHAVFSTSPAGLSRAEGWLAWRVAGAPTLVVVEGTGSFGAILTERLQAAGHEVVEAARMPAGNRRGMGKSDELDAVRIARAVLGLPVAALRAPRALATDGVRAAMRTIDLGIDARKPLTATQLATIATWRERDEDTTTATCRHEAVGLARRIRTLDGDLASNRTDITGLTRQETPQLLELTGVGAGVAASVLIA